MEQFINKDGNINNLYIFQLDHLKHYEIHGSIFNVFVCVCSCLPRCP